MKHYSGSDPDEFKWSEALQVGKRVLIFVLLIYGLLAVGAHFVSRRMIFPQPPVRYELTTDYVQLATADGAKLVGRHWICPEAKFTLLYLHGNYEDLGRVAEYAPQFLRAGYSVFAIDYRGYGHSTGTATEQNTYADVQLAYEYLRSTLKIPAEHIIIWGYSLGSGPAVELALRQPAAGLILQGAFVSTYRTMTGIPLFPGDKFVNLSKVSRLRLPILFIHGTDDTTVPFWHGEELYAAATARKAKLFVSGGQHGSLADFTGPRYWEAVKEFTDSL